MLWILNNTDIVLEIVPLCPMLVAQIKEECGGLERVWKWLTGIMPGL